MKKILPVGELQSCHTLL